TTGKSWLRAWPSSCPTTAATRSHLTPTPTGSGCASRRHSIGWRWRRRRCVRCGRSWRWQKGSGWIWAACWKGPRGGCRRRRRQLQPCGRRQLSSTRRP
ncbi:unnamed protein product, partial [Ixodes hexagonus]